MGQTLCFSFVTCCKIRYYFGKKTIMHGKLFSTNSITIIYLYQCIDTNTEWITLQYLCTRTTSYILQTKMYNKLHTIYKKNPKWPGPFLTAGHNFKLKYVPYLQAVYLKIIIIIIIQYVAT